MSDVTGNGLGTAVSAGSNFTITGGTRQTGNLFHSFSAFNLTPSQQATFQNTIGDGATINNVIGRISGTASSINGAINFDGTLPNANLFLVNPAGFVFGSSAALNIPGSFHASTSDNISLNGSLFDSTTDSTALANVLYAADPTAFGFLGGNGGITLENGADLSVNLNKTLTLAASSIALVNNDLTANSGRINLASVTGVGSVSNLESGALTVTGTGGNITANGLNLTVSGLSGGSDADGAGGDVYIVGGDLSLTNSSITSEVFGNIASGNINLNGTGAIILNNTTINTGHDQGTFIPEIVIPGFTIPGFPPFIPDIVIPGFTIPAVNNPAVVEGTGAAGDVFITGNKVTINNGSEIFSRTEDLGGGSTSGASGSVTIIATDTANVADFATFTTTPTDADIIIDTATIYSEAAGGGASGTVTISGNGGAAADTLYIKDSDISTIIGDSGASAGTVALKSKYALITNSTVHSDTVGTGDAGLIDIDGTEWLVQNNSAITTNVLTDMADVANPAITSIATGNGGDILIGDFLNYTNSFGIDGSSTVQSTTGGKSDGNAGNIFVYTDDFDVTNGSTVSVSTGVGSSGNSGTIQVIASTIDVTGGSTVESKSLGDGTPGVVALLATRGGEAAAGTQHLTVDNSIISTSNINGDVDGDLDSYTWLRTFGTGTIQNGSTIESKTSGSGDAGSIYIQNGNWTIDGATTTISSSQTGATGVGSAGTVWIGASPTNPTQRFLGTLNLQNGASIASDTLSSDAGSNAGDIFVYANTGITIDTNASITSNAAVGSAGNAGAIEISTEEDVVLGSDVTTDAVTIQGGGRVSSSNQGTGIAGSVTVNTDVFLLSGANTEISTNTHDGTGGGNIDFDIDSGGTAIINSGAKITSNTDGAGNAGKITLTGGSWEIDGTTNASQIQSSQTANGSGDSTLR